MLRNQALIDLLAQFPSKGYEPLYENLPDKEVRSADTDVWRLTINGSSTYQGGGAGVVLCAPEGTNISHSFKLEFPCTYNEAEYEAVVIGLTSALRMEIQRLLV